MTLAREIIHRARLFRDFGCPLYAAHLAKKALMLWHQPQAS